MRKIFALIILSIVPCLLYAKDEARVKDNPSLLAGRGGFFIEVPLSISFNSIEVVGNGFFKNAVKEYPDISNLTFTGMLGNLRKRYSGLCDMADSELYINIEKDNKALLIFTKAAVLNEKYNVKSTSGLFEKETNHFYTDWSTGFVLGAGFSVYKSRDIAISLGLSGGFSYTLTSDGLSIDNEYMKFISELSNYNFLSQGWSESYSAGADIATSFVLHDNYSVSLIFRERDLLDGVGFPVIDFRARADFAKSEAVHKYNISLFLDDVASIKRKGFAAFITNNTVLKFGASYKRKVFAHLKVFGQGANLEASIRTKSFEFELGFGKMRNRTLDSSNYFTQIVLKYFFEE